jgi:MoxR-like ATPase
MSKTTFKGTNDYIASDELMKTVDVAIALEKPLLVKGEPGTGKTMLAEAIAKALDKELYIWNIKSTTKAQEWISKHEYIEV